MFAVPVEAPVLQLALLALSSSLSPGPNNLLLAACASMFGARRTLPTVLGMYIGFGLMLVATGVGLAAVLVQWPQVLHMLQWGAAAYLAFLAAKLLRAQWTPPAGGSAPPGILRAAVLQVANPKLWLITVSTVSLCTPDGHARPSVMLVVGFVAMTVPSMLAYLHLGGLLYRLAPGSQARRVLNILLAVITAGSALLMLMPFS